MTAFLAATLAALVAGGLLVVVWRERRPLFPRVLAGVLVLAALVAGYAWWVSHGYAVAGERDAVVLENLALAEVAGSYRLTGTVRNRRADLAVSAVPVRLVVEACDGPAACRASADLERVLLVSLAPGESRAFVLVYNAAGARVTPDTRWRAEPGPVKAHRPVAR